VFRDVGGREAEETTRRGEAGRCQAEIENQGAGETCLEYEKVSEMQREIACPDKELRLRIRFFCDFALMGTDTKGVLSRRFGPG
jgi:hypothetical protein